MDQSTLKPLWDLHFKTISHIKEKKQRFFLISEFLQERTPLELSDYFENILTGVIEREPLCHELLHILLDREALFKSLGFETTEILKNLSRFAIHKVLEIFFMQRDPVENKKFLVENDEAGKRKLAELEEIPLGRQTNEARRTTSLARLQLYKYSTNPKVIENLLLNPLFTENLLLQITSRKQLNKELFKVIVKNEKWISRYPVKKSIAFNPFAPFYISCIIIYLLKERDLKMLINESNVSDILKEYGRQVEKLRET